MGEITVSTPRDRNSSFYPLFIKKSETILAQSVADRIIGPYAFGDSTRKISDWMEGSLGNCVSADILIAITDCVLPEIKACKSRILDFVYPIYEKEGLEKVPSLLNCIETFKILSDKLGTNTVFGRFDPMIFVDDITIDYLISKGEKIGN